MVLQPDSSAHIPNILVVDDDEDGRFMLRTFLELKGYRIIEARDGIEAIAAATSKRPDLILMDIRLPRLDGMSVARHLRAQPDSQSVPIVIVSGCDPARHRPMAVAAGCDEYLFKPINLASLDKILERYLARSPVAVRRTPSGKLKQGINPY